MTFRSPIAPPAGAILILDDEERERHELVRTQQALAAEVRDLMRTRTTLAGEIDLLRAEAQQLSSGDNNFERFIKSNRRFFERVLEREVARTSRDINGRFSTAILSLSSPMPRWFVGFLSQMTRASDLCVRSGATEFWLFLHGAGGLGRRIFQSRLAQSLAVAGKHHKTPLSVEIGASTYPSDGDSPSALLSRAGERVRPVDRQPLPAPTPAPRDLHAGFALTPPAGVPIDPPRGQTTRVRRALEDAAIDGSSGEIVVRSDAVVGRVYLCGGMVAWAHCTSHALSLTEFLVRSCGADQEEVRFAYEYCKKSGGNFAETLIEFGTFSRHNMRHVLQRHLRAHLGAVLKLPHPDVLFLPQNRRYHSDLLFPLEALLPLDPDRRAAPRQAKRDAIVAALIKR